MFKVSTELEHPMAAMKIPGMEIALYQRGSSTGNRSET
jgi:hypothetical protein